jgi:carbamoyltransferase
VALNLWHRFLEKPRISPERAGTWERAPETSRTPGTSRTSRTVPPYADGMNGSYLGPSYSEEEIAAFLEANGYKARRLTRTALANEVAALLQAEKVVGLLMGRMEFGPRALGARSIIGDPRSPKMQSVMNLKIKFRESFRPFAPAVLREHVHDWFEMNTDSPYMLLVADVQDERRLPMPPEARTLWGIDQLNVARSTVPAITHVDFSARVQTVRRDTNPTYYDIIEAFYRRTDCPVIVNTSFNVRGEPIVCTPEDAYRCFMRTNMDALVLETFLLEKVEQTPLVDDESWRNEFVLD